VDYKFGDVLKHFDPVELTDGLQVVLVLRQFCQENRGVPSLDSGLVSGHSYESRDDLFEAASGLRLQLLHSYIITNLWIYF